MRKSCRQLACDERCQINVLLSGGLSIREIARELGRSPATISREIARNRGERGYRHRQAQDRACARRSRASGVLRKLTDALWQHIRGLLAEGGAAPEMARRADPLLCLACRFAPSRPGLLSDARTCPLRLRDAEPGPCEGTSPQNHGDVQLCARTLAGVPDRRSPGGRQRAASARRPDVASVLIH